MSVTEPLCHLIGINPSSLTKEENLILEAELFSRLCEELKEIFKNEYRDYFHLIKINPDKENVMLGTNFIRCVINDILSSEEYSMEGIAYYTETPEDVICDVVTGLNPAPSFPLSCKIINLHRSARPHLYREIMKKVALEYLTPQSNTEEGFSILK